VTAYDTSLTTATNPATRTATAVAAKNTARAQLVADIRLLVRRIQATPSVTPAQKTSLGITVPDHVRTPVPPPTTRPVLSVANISSRTLSIRLADETTPTRRAKPPGVDGAEVYSFAAAAGTPPPADLTAWQYKGLAKRADFNVPFDAGDVGKIGCVRAQWVSTRGANGPVSDEITGSIAA
jgi:hypothetical protein